MQTCCKGNFNFLANLCSWASLLEHNLVGNAEDNYIYETRHEISNNVVFATSKASDQHAHMRSLISAFASRLNIL